MSTDRAAKGVACLALLALTGCDQHQTRTPVTATIISVAKDQTAMGCAGTDWMTYVRLSNGRSAKLCGVWGKPGEQHGGVWIEGSSDSISNGYRP